MPENTGDKLAIIELAEARPLNSVLPLRGTPYVEPQNIKEIVEPIWTQAPMNPSKAA